MIWFCNSLWKSDVSQFVAVPDPVVIAVAPPDTVVGDVAILVCNVFGAPSGTTITYQWKRADMSSTSQIISETNMIQLPSVDVSDAGVYTCEVTVSDSTNNPHVIPASGSGSNTLTVTSKCGNINYCASLPTQCMYSYIKQQCMLKLSMKIII